MFLRCLIPTLLMGSCASSVLPIQNSQLEEDRAAAVFKHPGVFVSKPQLDFVKSKVESKQEPWTSAYNAMLAHPLASPNRQPKPQADVHCDSGSSNDQGNGCHNEREDALAAWANALAWYLSGDGKYAKKAIAFLDAWSATLRSHGGANANLQTGWAGTTWARAAELMRYSNAGWTSDAIAKFENMLRTKFLPTAAKGDARTANWDLVLLETALEIAVFLNDRVTYDTVNKLYPPAVAASIYLSSDGRLPRPARGHSSKDTDIISFWHGQKKFVDGLQQETCRDLVHMGYGLASVAHFAETAWIQGTDYYSGDIGQRLQQALEFHAPFLNGEKVPNWLCGGTIQKLHDQGAFEVTEVGLNALGTRLGWSLNETAKFTQKHRPFGSNYLFIGWETVSHARNPAKMLTDAEDEVLEL